MHRSTRPQLSPVIRRRWISLMATSLGLALATLQPASATLNTWVLPDSGFWDDSANWSAGLPAPGQDLFINFGSYPSPSTVFTHLRTGNVTVRSVSTGSELWITDGATLTTTDLTATANVDVDGGTLNLTNLGTLTSFGLRTGGTLNGNVLVSGSGGIFGEATLNGRITYLGNVEIDANLLGTSDLVLKGGGIVTSLNARSFAYEKQGTGPDTIVTVTNGMSVSSLFGTATLDLQSTVDTGTFGQTSTGSVIGGQLNVTGGTADINGLISTLLRLTDAQGTIRSDSIWNDGSLELRGDSLATFEEGAGVNDLLLTDSSQIGGGSFSTYEGSQFVWNGGVIKGEGTASINGSALLEGSTLAIGSGRELQFNDTVDWRDGDIGSSDGDLGAFMTVGFNGLLTIANSSIFDAGRFLNSGEVIKESGSGGDGVTTFLTRFDNAGTLDVRSGTLRLLGGGVHTGLIKGTETSLIFGSSLDSSHELSDGSAVEGGATLQNGVFHLNGGNVSSATFLVKSGSILRSIEGSTQVLGGAKFETNLSRLDVEQGSTLTISNLTNLSDGVLTRGNYTVGGRLILGAPLRTLAQGTLNLSGQDATVETSQGDAFDYLESTGALGRIVSRNNAFIQFMRPGFVNSGTIQALNGGDVRFAGSLQNSGDLLANDGNIIFEGNSTTTGRMISTGGGELNFSSGLHAFRSGSVLKGFARVNADAELAFADNAQFDEATIENDGGDVQFIGGTAPITSNLNLRSGNFRITGSTGFAGRVELGGNLNVESGTLDLRGGGASSGKIVALPGSNIEFSGGVFDLNDKSETRGPVRLRGGRINLNTGSLIEGPIVLDNGWLETFGGSLGNSTLDIQTNGNLRVNSGRLVLRNGLDNFDSESGLLSGGGLYVVGGSTLAYAGGPIRKNRARIVVSGAGSNFEMISSRNAGDDGLSQLNSNEGSFSVGNSGTFATSVDLNNSGTMMFSSGSKVNFSNLGNSGTMDNSGNGTEMDVQGSMGNSGTMNYRDGSTGNVTDNVNNSGTFSVLASTVTVGGDYNQTGGSTFVNNSGTLRATNFNINGGSLGGDGTFEGNVNNSGTMAPGASPGLLTITGNYLQNHDGFLQMEIAGLNLNQYDRLHASGSLTLDGTLQLVFLNGFSPKIGDRFDILQGASRTGTFSSWTVTGTTTPLALRYTTTGVQVEAVPEPATLAAMGLGLAGLAARRRRKTR